MGERTFREKLAAILCRPRCWLYGHDWVFAGVWDNSLPWWICRRCGAMKEE